MKHVPATLAALLALAFASSAHAVIDDTKAKDLMKAGGCSACHSVDKKIVGPAYKDVAAKHKGDANAAPAVEKAVRTGAKGNYGPVPMPATPVARLSDDDLRALIAWILTR